MRNNINYPPQEVEVGSTIMKYLAYILFFSLVNNFVFADETWPDNPYYSDLYCIDDVFLLNQKLFNVKRSRTIDEREEKIFTELFNSVDKFKSPEAKVIFEFIIYSFSKKLRKALENDKSLDEAFGNLIDDYDDFSAYMRFKSRAFNEEIERQYKEKLKSK